MKKKKLNSKNPKYMDKSQLKEVKGEEEIKTSQKIIKLN